MTIMLVSLGSFVAGFWIAALLAANNRPTPGQGDVE